MGSDARESSPGLKYPRPFCATQASRISCNEPVKRAILTALTLPALFGGAIDFERSAPCAFLQAEPLGNEYTPAGPAFHTAFPASGGAAIGQCGNFGINARSGTDFLAFNNRATLINGNTPAGPEVIRFSVPRISPCSSAARRPVPVTPWTYMTSIQFFSEP